MTAPTEPQMREWNCLNHPDVRFVLAQFLAANLRDRGVALPPDEMRQLLERFVFSRVMAKLEHSSCET